MDNLAAVRTQALTFPNDVRMQLNAANALYEAERYEDAVRFYYNALELGLPIHGRLEFYTRFGIALRWAGALEDSLTVLLDAMTEYRYDKTLPIWTALTLHELGRDSEAIATLMQLLVDIRDVVPDVAQNRDRIEAYIPRLLDGTSLSGGSAAAPAPPAAAAAPASAAAAPAPAAAAPTPQPAAPTPAAAAPAPAPAPAAPAAAAPAAPRPPAPAAPRQAASGGQAPPPPPPKPPGT